MVGKKQTQTWLPKRSSDLGDHADVVGIFRAKRNRKCHINECGAGDLDRSGWMRTLGSR